MTIKKKKVTLELVGMDGNAFFLMGAFSRQAKKEGWTKEEIDTVLTDAKSSGYDHLLSVLIDHCKSEDKFLDVEEDGDEIYDEI